MVVTRIGVGGLGSGSGSGAGSGDITDVIDERLHEIIAAEVTSSILDMTPVIFGMVKVGMMEIIDERLISLNVEFAAGQIGTGPPRFESSRRVGRQSFWGSGTPLLADVV